MKPINQQIPGPLVETRLDQPVTFQPGASRIITLVAGRPQGVACASWSADSRLLTTAYNKVDAAARALGVDAVELLENADLEAVIRATTTSVTTPEMHARLVASRAWLLAHQPELQAP